jgi:signal transduction histidine kinase
MGTQKLKLLDKRLANFSEPKSIQPLESIEAELRKEGKWSGELFHRTKNGCELAIQSYWQAKFNEKHQIIEIFEQNVDVTERKNAERLATIGATAGMVGHDIRNPLQAIAGEIFLGKDVLKKLPDGEFKRSIKECLNNIDEQISYIDKIVSDLQDYAKPLQPKFEEVNIKNIVKEVLSAINVGADREQDIQVKVSISEDSETLRTDEIYLRRILQNLINNSVQAMPEGGKLSVTASRQKGGVVISVLDTGSGIPAEIRTKLFLPLVTMKSKGQGFGLAVVKKFTEGLGGTISFESEVGKGTRFIIELPC